jgi:hypothetical protein
MQFKAYVTEGAAPSVEQVADDYQAAEGEVLFSGTPSVGQLSEAFPDAVLADAKAMARVQISAAAERARQQFISPGSGKALAYQEKANEAQDFLVDPTAGQEGHAAGMYPLIYAEVGITAETPLGVATVINGRFGMFKLIEAAIARMEAGAQKTVKEAESLAAILATMDGLTWPAPEEA